MSNYKAVFLICDQCGTDRHFGRTVSDAHDTAELWGWTRTTRKDYCDDCSKTRALSETTASDTSR